MRFTGLLIYDKMNLCPVISVIHQCSIGQRLQGVISVQAQVGIEECQEQTFFSQIV